MEGGKNPDYHVDPAVPDHTELVGLPGDGPEVIVDHVHDTHLLKHYEREPDAIELHAALQWPLPHLQPRDDEAFHASFTS